MILGVNFNKEREDGLLSEQVRISPMQNFILELLNDNQVENIEACLKSQLESLPYLIPIESASGKPFSRLVLGQMLSTEGIDKHLFIYSNKDRNSNVSTFFLKRKDKEFWLILNIIEKTEGINIDTKTIKLDEGYKNCVQVTIEKSNKHGIYYEIKEIKKYSISTFKENWDGEFKEMGQRNLLQQEEDGALLIKEENDLKVNLNYALSLLKELGEKEIEKGFYEVMQGLFIGNKYASEENNKFRVFRKVTVSRRFTIDLAVSILRKYEGAYKEDELVIVKLDKQSEDTLFQQPDIEKYLKSISYLGEGRNLSIALNGNNIENISVENINDGKFIIKHDDTDNEYHENLKNDRELFLDLIQNGSSQELQSLLSNKQNINRDEKLRILRANNYDPFLLAIERGDSEILELLLEYACNIDNESFVQEILKSKDEYDNTLLHLALEQQNESIIKELIEQCKSYDVLDEILESQNNDGDTLLHISIKEGNEEIYKLLMDEYNDYKILEKMLICENDDSETPLGYAIDNEDFNFFQELKYTYSNIEELCKENEDLGEFIFAKTTPSYSWRASDMDWHALFAEYDRDDGSDKSDSSVVDEEEQLQSNFQVHDREEQSRHRESEEQEEVCSNVSEPSVSSTSSPYEQRK
ncbi:ankyrin repeat domain-containing protein [Wolbachia endosymbiont (group A) of Udea olivalis]|uniref:ankyrin repeat domain-containing protein n=1 Tax=Wolbachia endosymbiont (group A) of Udea olivalis TaxID=3066183 RepID=UPI003132E434